VLLTRIWGVLLAALATFCLAGMFLLARGSSEDFTEENRTALRAVTEAGIAALEAQIEASPVRQVAAVRIHKELQEALARTPEQEAKLPAEKLPLAQLFTEAAEDMRVRNRSDMTLAMIDTTGAIAAVSGIGEPLLSELVGSSTYQELPADQAGLFSLALGGQLQIVRVEPLDEKGRRLVAFEPLQIGAGSLLRRVLGTDNPAGMVRNGKLLGEIIGDQPVSAEIEKFANDHRDDAPDDGASKVFTVGDGLDARIGALGRVPGPAGRGKSAAMLVVLSRQTAAAGQRDLSESLSDAMRKNTGSVNWVLIIGLLAVCAALSIYLPQIEALSPMRRLADEFVGVARGAQHQIFHDRYGGPTGEVARAANAAHEALRQAYLAELEIDEEMSEDSETAGQRRPKTVRGRRLTRSQRKLEESGHDGESARSGSTAPSRAANDAADVEQATTGRRHASRDRVSMPPRGQTPAPGPLPAPPPMPAADVGRPAAPPFSAPAVPPARPPGPAHTPIRTPAVPPPAKPTFQPPAPVAGLAPPTARPRTPIAMGPPSSMSTPSPATLPSADGDDAKAAYYREIFEEFLQVKIACGEPTAGFTFDKFVKKLQKNTQDILDKHSDVRDVQFTVYVKDGKAALKAKIVRQA
jgi:hypothetical protein